MFDLDQAITEWRRQMMDGGVTSREVLDELESHLRDDVEQQLDTGINAERTFHDAVQRIGKPETLECEFAKFNRPKKKEKQPALAFAGATESEGTLIMNTAELNMTLERPWMTYIKAAAWLVPCLSLWVLSTVFLFPKLKQIWLEADFNEPFPRGGMLISDFFVHYGFAIFIAVAISFGLLEWRSRIWKRYRRVCLGVVAFVLNSAVLFLIWLMLVTALVTAPALLQGGKKSVPPAAAQK